MMSSFIILTSRLMVSSLPRINQELYDRWDIQQTLRREICTKFSSGNMEEKNYI
jgi:hypothetical protein